MGEQILELGFVSSKGFLPVDRQIYIGKTKKREKQKPFQDARSAVAKDYQDAENLDKNEMLEQMVSRAIKLGIKPKYILGDSWFGHKGNIKMALENELTGIFMMKRGSMKYRLNGNNYNAKELFEFVRRRMKRKGKQRWRTFELIVDLNLSETKKQEDQWIKVKLIFTSPINPGKNNWNLLLCTDISMKTDTILQTYALRWSIEVYFKEIKQNLGFLKEQSGNYATHYASIHLATIRYLMLFQVMLSQGYHRYRDARDANETRLEIFSYMSVLWEVFRNLIYGVLNSFLKSIDANVLGDIKKSIELRVMTFLNQALALDTNSLELQLKAEKMVGD